MVRLLTLALALGALTACGGFQVYNPPGSGDDTGSSSSDDTTTDDIDTNTPPDCGNNIREGNEACDGNDLAGQTCESLGFSGGILECRDSCADFKTQNCEQCGNNTVEGSELCDGSDLDGMSCAALGYDAGTLSCNSSCTAFNESNCGYCTNTCSYAGDGDCDDGGPNSDYSLCTYGTDCQDCGVRPPL